MEKQGSEIKSWWEMAGERSRGQFFKIDCSASSWCYRAQCTVGWKRALL